MTDEATARALYQTAQVVAVDVETTGLRPGVNRVAVVSLAAPARPPAVLHAPGGTVPGWVLDVLSRPGTTVIGHNCAAFDLPFLVRAGLRLRPDVQYVDTLVLEQLCLTSGRRDLRRDLASTVRRRLGVTVDKSAVDRASWGGELTGEQVLYCANDVALLPVLADAQLTRLRELHLLDAARLEHQVVPVTASMVALGVPFNAGTAGRLVEAARAGAAAAAKQLRDEGLSNPRSPAAVRRWFADRWGLELASTSADVLGVVAASRTPVAGAAARVLEARSGLKLTMYDAGWVSSHVDPDGRVRARYWQLGTDTGRFSSSDPNLQQVPRRLRAMVGYGDGAPRRVVACDYSQIEVLIAAALYGDPALLEAVASSDVHTWTASHLFRVPPDTVTPEQRATAKAATFTVLFAGGAPGVQRSALALGVALPEAEAERVVRQYSQAFPRTAAALDAVRARVRRARVGGTSYAVRVPGGPLRHLFGDRLSASAVVNTLVQGTAAVGLKRAVRRVWERFPDAVVAVVHDEIVLDVAEDRVDEVVAVVVDAMVSEMHAVIGLRPRVGTRVGLEWQ